MNLLVLGKGKMGSTVIELARERGHNVEAHDEFDNAGSCQLTAERLRGIDVVADFTWPGVVLGNISACAAAGINILVGTTGWYDKVDQVRAQVEKSGIGFLYGANFSIGVNLFYRLVESAGELFRGLGDYDAFIEEAHHALKRDAPSGTALELGRRLAARLGHEVPIASTRAGHIPGVHRVGFDSAEDQVMLVHTARSREGFAAGALAAAGWLAAGNRGVHTFAAVLDQILDWERREGRDRR